MAGILEDWMVSAEYTCIEQVPELQHHKYGEKDCQMMCVHSTWEIFEVDQ